MEISFITILDSISFSVFPTFISIHTESLFELIIVEAARGVDRIFRYAFLFIDTQRLLKGAHIGEGLFYNRKWLIILF